MVQLDSIVQRINAAFGPEDTGMDAIPPEDVQTLGRIFAQDSYQDFLQDQISRQIIRDYLTNAVILGFLQEQQLGAIADLVETPESRAALSLHMLMSSVEEAADLLVSDIPLELTPLEPGDDAPPNIHLVQN